MMKKLLPAHSCYIFLEAKYFQLLTHRQRKLKVPERMESEGLLSSYRIKNKVPSSWQKKLQK